MHKILRIFFLLSIYTLLVGCGQRTSEPAVSKNETPAEKTDSEAVIPDESPATEHILFFGDSITAGYGIELPQAYPALIRQKIDSLNWPFTVTNAGFSGETSSGGLNRIDWLLREPVDVFVLELGGNDGLRGISPELTRRNLNAIVDRVKDANPDATVIIAGMQVPPNLGISYTRMFKNIFPAVAEENDAALIPFILEGVGGIPELNLPDGIHPTAEGHEIIAETVWNTLRPILEKRMENIPGCETEQNLASATEADGGCEIDLDAF